MTDYATRSYWLENEYIPGPRLAGDLSVDVIIVGGGFMGLWTAYFLKRAEPALEIAVVEREVVGYGASGRNGGFAMTLLNRGLNDMVKAFGDDAARGRVHYGFGYCGHGVAPSHLGGQILADLVLGRRSERTDLCFVRATALPFLPSRCATWASASGGARCSSRTEKRSGRKTPGSCAS